MVVTAGWSNGAHLLGLSRRGSRSARCSDATVGEQETVPERAPRALRRPARTSTSCRWRPQGPRARGWRMIVTRRIAAADRAGHDRGGRAAGLVLLLPELLRDDPEHHAPGRRSALGLLGGAMVGAVCGFAARSCCWTPRCSRRSGSHRSILLTVGYLAGRYREGTEISNSLMPPILIGGADHGGRGRGSPRSSSCSAVRDAGEPAGAAGDLRAGPAWRSLLAIPFYPLIRRVLRPAIVDDVAPAGAWRSSDPRRLEAPAPAAPAPAESRRARGGCAGLADVRRARAAR